MTLLLNGRETPFSSINQCICNHVMDFNNSWQQCIYGHNRVSHMYLVPMLTVKVTKSDLVFTLPSSLPARGLA